MTPVNKVLKRHGYRQGRTLVVGSKIYGECEDRRALYRDAIGLDMQEGPGVDLQHDLEKPLPARVGKFEHIDCCSVLEHVQRPWLMAKNIEAVLVDEGTILVAVPFVWRVHAYPGDYWRFTPASLEILFPNIRWIEKQFYCNGQVVDKPPSFNTPDKTRWLGRSEVVAFGEKCDSRY